MVLQSETLGILLCMEASLGTCPPDISGCPALTHVAVEGGICGHHLLAVHLAHGTTSAHQEGC